MVRYKEHSDLIKEHFKKRGITQTWLDKELGMSLSSPPHTFAIANRQISLSSSMWRTCLVCHQKN